MLKYILSLGFEAKKLIIFFSLLCVREILINMQIKNKTIIKINLYFNNYLIFFYFIKIYVRFDIYRIQLPWIELFNFELIIRCYFILFNYLII